MIPGELLDRVIEAVTFMVDAGLRSDRLHEPVALANYARAAILIAQEIGSQDYLTEAAEAWVKERNRFCPSAPELANKAAILRELSTICIGIDCLHRGQESVAIMRVSRDKWAKATLAQREAKKAAFCAENGIVRALSPRKEASGE